MHLLLATLVIGIVASSLLAFPQVHAAGTNFDNVVIIAMENQNYVDVMGTGTGSSNAPFIGTILNSGHSATYPNYHSYGNGPGLPSISGCSAACYVALVAGGTQGVSDGYCCITHPTLTDNLQAAGLTWQAYCESGCGRGPDHFPFYDATGALLPNTFAGSSVSTADFVTAANSATPPNFLWFTPTDSHNMHDNSVQTGDSYLQTFLVGSGSLSSPSLGSLLASNLFQPGHRTLLMLWWDEYDPSPQLFYSPALLSSSTIDNSDSYMEYSWLHLIERNWGLPTLTSNDAAAVLPAVFAGPQPLTTSFSFTPSTPNVNMIVTFTAQAAGGTAPYTFRWTFGDGGTGTGTIVTHTYTSAQSFTITETATDSSSPQQSATSSRALTVVSSLTGNFGVCNNLPQGWNCGNLHPSAPSPSSAQIVNGVFQSRQSNPRLGGSNDYYYSTTQRGTFPWSPCSAPASGVIPSGVTSVSVNFTSLSYNPGSSPSSDRYHIYIALYYWLPNGAVSAGGSTYRCLDTQVRVENIGGTFSPIGSTATYNPADSFGWDNVTLQVSPGQTGLLTANVANQCLQDLKAWGLPTNTPCQLAGIEIGTEGYQFQELDVNWYHVNLNVGPMPLWTSFTVLPSNPIVNTPVTFTATTLGGTSPYTISWNFGDGAMGTGASVTHTYTAAQSFTVTETATDSSTPAKTASSTLSVTVYTSLPLSTTFSVSSSSPQVGQTVTFSASASGGTSPYAYAVAFGDGGTQSGNSVTYVYSAAGSYTATVTVTDSASPQASISKSITVNVPPLVPPALSVPANQTVTAGTWINFTITATSANTGGTVALSATGLPTGATFDPASGLFSWKPSSGQTGSHTITFIATDSSSPSTPTSKPMGIQVNQAAPGGSNGGNGGSGGGSNGSCLFCGIFSKISTNFALLLIGGLLGLIASLAILTIRARASLEHTKRKMERLNR